MKKLALALSALVLLACVGTARAEGGGMFFGTNLGVTHFIPEDGDGVTLVGWPNQSGLLFPVVVPGFRVGGFLDASRTKSLYVDTGMMYASSEGESMFNMQGLLGVEFAFGDKPTVPYVDVNGGVMHIGTDSNSYNSMVLGGGLGVRHRFQHGHGAVRFEAHVDRQFEAKEDDEVVLPNLTAVGAKIGFDVYLR